MSVFLVDYKTISLVVQYVVVMVKRSSFFARTVASVLALVCLVAIVLPASSRASAAEPLAIPTLTAPPPLDPHAAATTWPDGATFALARDVVHLRAADEPTTVRLASDAHFLYVRFDVTQREPAVASQHNNDTIAGGSGGSGGLSWSSDDAVWIDLWPSGTTGFMYQFEANPNGSHNEASSENAAFAPHWESQGAIHDGGYTVTMAIPLAVIHGAHDGTWRVQLIRYTHATAAEDVWSYDATQNSPDDVSRAGAVQFTLLGKPPLPKPRAAIYALGSLASAPAGGSTSRIGADLSIPVTPTAAVFATLHPDYSNVELDQQTIAPTVYQRQYSEIRPFFTQAASNYDNFNCDACNVYWTNLYTPAIPTFAQGYAFEGKQGALSFAAFDAIASSRNDGAAALNYVSPDTRWGASFQHVTSNLPGIVDDSNEVGMHWGDHRYLSAYVNASDDTGTNVTNNGQAVALDAGGGYGTSHFALYGGIRSVGPQYDPIDGYVTHPGIGGYALYSARIWDFAPRSKLAAIGISGNLDRYQGPTDGQAQSDNLLVLDVLTKSAWDLQLYSGSDYWRFGSTLTPISQNGGFTIFYHSGLQTDNPGGFPAHGSSATPTELSYNTGRYGAGRLDTWLRTSTMRIGERGTLTFTLDNTSQWLTATPNNIQWFDGIAYSYQITPDSSFAIGLRRVNGNAPVPNGGGNCAGVCSNVSVAYHIRLPHEELYVAYGDPNTLSTVPQALLKLIFYIGQKGS
jgi:hypothetical protein